LRQESCQPQKKINQNQQLTDSSSLSSVDCCPLGAFIMPVLSVTKRFENLGQGQLRALPVKGIVWGLFNHPGCDEYQI